MYDFSRHRKSSVCVCVFERFLQKQVKVCEGLSFLSIIFLVFPIEKSWGQKRGKQLLHVPVSLYRTVQLYDLCVFLFDYRSIRLLQVPSLFLLPSISSIRMMHVYVAGAYFYSLFLPDLLFFVFPQKKRGDRKRSLFLYQKEWRFLLLLLSLLSERRFRLEP